MTSEQDRPDDAYPAGGRGDGQPRQPGSPTPWSADDGQLRGWHPTPPPRRPQLYEPELEVLPPPVGARYGHPPNAPGPSGHTGRRWARAGGGAAAGAGVAAKGGLLTKLFFVFKGATFLVKFKFAGTMALSVLLYSWIYGIWFAVGLVGLLAVHEFGHYAAFRAQGVKVSLPTFVPFLGAYVKTESPIRSVAHEAAGGLAGPAAGALAGIGLFELSRAMNSPLLQALAYVSFFLNLFNLLPVPFLDGGRVAGALHPALWVAGIAGGVVVEMWRPSRILPFILLFGVISLVPQWRRWKTSRHTYYAIASSTRVAIGSAYAAVAILCLWGMNVAYVPR
ncbi:MAG: hypothetical protein QOJ62_795 [Actinomycetota bacterium]|nr:hypothetical protein [Actinomycetota bacterium]